MKRNYVPVPKIDTKEEIKMSTETSFMLIHSTNTNMQATVQMLEKQGSWPQGLLLTILGAAGEVGTWIN